MKKCFFEVHKNKRGVFRYLKNYYFRFQSLWYKNIRNSLSYRAYNNEHSRFCHLPHNAVRNSIEIFVLYQNKKSFMPTMMDKSQRWLLLKTKHAKLKNENVLTFLWIRYENSVDVFMKIKLNDDKIGIF